jgi:hypothetical protein
MINTVSTRRGLQRNDILYFLHIAKTGGMTFRSILSKYFQPGEICQEFLIQDLLRLPLEGLGRYRFFYGHFGYNLQQLLPKKPVYVTLLREPLARSISLYLHVCRNSKHRLYDRVTRHKMSLLDFVRDEETGPSIWNFQTRNIACDLDYEALVSMEPSSIKALKFEEELNKKLHNMSDDLLLERAKQRIEQFAFVGITERMDESVRVLAKILDLKEASEIPILNKSPERLQPESLSRQTIREIRKRTILDQELYSHAQNIFNALHSTIF